MSFHEICIRNIAQNMRDAPKSKKKIVLQEEFFPKNKQGSFKNFKIEFNSYFSESRSIFS